MEMVTIISNMIHLGNTQNIEKDRFVRLEDHVFDDGIWNIRQRNGQQAKSSFKHDSKKKPEINPKSALDGFQEMASSYLHQQWQYGLIVDQNKNFGLMESVEIHMGKYNMIGKIICRDSKYLPRTLSNIKKLDGVEEIVWSEEV
jgi:hypothetical protein